MSADPPILSGADVLPAMEGRPGAPRAGSKQSNQPKARRGGGRFGSLNAFIDITARHIDTTAALIWLILWRDERSDGLATASQTDLARRAGVSPSTVYRALRRLEKRGLLIVVRKGRLGIGASIYRLRARLAADRS